MSYGPFELVSYPCPLCGASEEEHVQQKTGVASAQRFNIVRCSNCKLVRVNPRIANLRIAELYDREYYAGRGFDRSVRYTGEIGGWARAENDRIIRTVETALKRPITGVRWIDVGCGTGALLESVRSKGAVGLGSDDSDAAMEACRARNVPFLRANQLNEVLGTFDVVTAVEVIEHVTDPIQFLRFLVSLVRKGGIVYVHTENWNVVRRFPGTPYIMPEGHLQYFTPTSMRKLFATVGLNESTVVDRCWFILRRLPGPLQTALPEWFVSQLRFVFQAAAADFTPFPVGIR